MKPLLRSVCVWCILSVSVWAVGETITEDFEGLDTSSTEFSHGIFNHSINSSSSWDFYIHAEANQHLALFDGGSDKITFSLNPGQYVEYAQIDYIDWDGDSYVEFQGTAGTYKVFGTGGDWDTWDSISTSGRNLGQITSITLFSNEGSFDNLSVNVVPEPTSLGFLLLGAWGLKRRK